MKAITLKFPWWEKILNGEKTIETRTWTTTYRGDILICAGAPKKKIVAICTIKNIRKMNPTDKIAAGGVEYRPDLFSWELENVRPVAEKDVRGMPGIFEVNYENA
jgi:hypothetical protein